MALYNLRNNPNSPNRATNASSKAPKSSTLNVKQISPCSQPRSRRPKRKYIKPNRIATLKTLPDVPLLRLLSFLPHTQKLRVEKVCRRLRFMTRTTCLQQKTLILYQKSTLCQVLPMLTRYLFFTDGQSSLGFNRNMVEINKKSFRGIDTKIFDRFPVVKHLKIYHVDLPRFKDLFSLLDHYQETIETFELFCDEAHKRKFYHEALFEKLNKLPKLRHLYLPFDLQSKDFPILWKEIREKCSTVFTQNFHTGNPAMHEERVLNPIRENPERISNPSDENICHGTFQQYNAYQEIQVFNKDSNLCGLGAYWGKFDALGDAVEQFHADAVVNTVTFQNGVPRLSHFTHLDLELPLNAQFEPFLESLSVHRNMTHLRLCVKDRFQIGENYRLIFNYVTPNNYRQLFCIVLPQVRFLTLSRFEFELDDPVLKLYLPHLFPNLERLHFEHCYFQSGFSMSVTEHFANLCQVWYNNGFLFDVKRKPAVETDEERRLRQLDMKNIDAKLDSFLLNKFCELHSESCRQLGNFSEIIEQGINEWYEDEFIDLDEELSDEEFSGEDEDEDDEDEEEEVVEEDDFEENVIINELVELNGDAALQDAFPVFVRNGEILFVEYRVDPREVEERIDVLYDDISWDDLLDHREDRVGREPPNGDIDYITISDSSDDEN